MSPVPAVVRMPHALAPGHGSTPDIERLRALMRSGSKSFFAASLLLPARVRGPATALYAFCRLADDAIDLGTDPLAAMVELRCRLDAIYDGRPHAIDADRALASVVHRHDIPRALPDALLEGFLWDTQQRRYDTLDDLQAYAARVAGTVGAMMALVMGARSASALARACDLGVAMQLTNIARDVGEDARAGRLYLPRQWLAEAGVDADAWLRAPGFNAGISQVVQRLLRAAAELYRRSEHGLAELPRDCRPAICAARLVYAEIGEQLERDGMDSVTRRVVVSRQRKLALMARAAAAAVTPRSTPRQALPVLPAVRFLVDAAAWPEPQPPVRRAGSTRPMTERIGWIIDLQERQVASRQCAGRVLG